MRKVSVTDTPPAVAVMSRAIVPWLRSKIGSSIVIPKPIVEKLALSREWLRPIPIVGNWPRIAARTRASWLL